MTTLPPEVEQQTEGAESLAPVITALMAALAAAAAAEKTAGAAVKAVDITGRVGGALARLARAALSLAASRSNARTRKMLYLRAEAGVRSAVRDGVLVLEQALTHVARKLQHPDGQNQPKVPMYESNRVLARRVAQTVRSSALVGAAQAEVEEQEDPEPAEIMKQWNSVNDNRTRPSHAFLGSATYEYHRVPLADPFVTIDGDTLMFPGDPLAPLDETSGCRCHLTIYVR